MSSPVSEPGMLSDEAGTSAVADALLHGLNEAQADAVTSDAVPLAIHAGAGSGKTRVLTRRIAWRSLTGRSDPRRVLALTFTRKAAAELRSRLRILGLRDQVAAGTFHSVAYAQLRIWWNDNDITEPQLLDRKFGLVTSLLPRDKRATDTLDVVGEIEWAKARRVTPERYTAAAEEAGRNPPLPLTVMAGIFKDYEDLKSQRGMVDFDDLLDGCRRALTGDGRKSKLFADAQRWRFRHLYVDEFQDVNPLQFSLLDAWLGGRNDLCVVGDPDQAIYGWNGADADHLRRFNTHFRDGTVLELRQNYRSTPQVLRTAAAALSNRDPMEANRPSGPNPTLTTHPDARTEAAAIARRVRDSRGADRPWSQQAVLVRTNAQAEVVATALENVDIPVRTRSGSALLDRGDVKLALSSLTRRNGSLAEQLGDLRSDTGPDTPDQSDNPRDAEREAAFSELRRLIDEFLALNPRGTPDDFNKWAHSNAGAGVDASSDAVEVSTFHGAKGLEWPIVHIAGLEKGLVPIAHARDPRSLAEERRLLYVALSRAEEALHLTWAAERTFGTRTSKRSPSPWLDDLQAAIDELDKPLNPRDQSRQAKAARSRTRRPEPPDNPDVTAVKAWRLATARSANVPAFVVFTDATLEALLELRPTTPAELLAVPGIGPVKVDRYGDALLEVLAGLD
ncbi:MAG: ATP-dependent DNA helicase UvrD2 [Acidimicrobiales bacterium]|nr:ATP-dependent DNA helicase UvrD2 [Acidimicrobiales bacterium]MDP7209380.1 ATP-dependent DNA helicase UvrD2 [Acidimicrobiales bacterium]HJO98672.1 ATP-dependent DNA helicase UvrD2 [Acidimicrobiales bacterium]